MNKYTADREEVLRYLAYRGQELDQTMQQKLHENTVLCEKTARPRHISIICQRNSKGDIDIPGYGLLELPGKDIHNHLQQAEQCLLMAATLGMEVELKLRQLQGTDMTAAMIFDAACDALIEDVMDKTQEEYAAKLEAERLQLGQRYSPGYGDLPLELQPALLQALNAGRRIGLSSSASHLLVPRKSVTALAGIYRPEQSQQALQLPMRKCSSCNLYATCLYRKGGTHCGNRE